MAQSQNNNNLVAGIVVDTSKLKTDLAAASALIRKFTSELNAAVKAGNAEAEALARTNLQGAIRLREQLTATIKKQTTATVEATAAHHREGESIRQLAAHYGHLAHAIGLPVEGLKALKFGLGAFAGAQAIRQVREVIGELNELQNTIKKIGGATGTNVEDLKKARSTARSIVGQEGTAIADTMVEAFNKGLDESRRRAGQGGVEIARGAAGESAINVARGGAGGGGAVRDVSTVLRGGRDSEAIQWDDLNKAMEINTSRRRANNDIRAETARKILAETDATTRDELTQKRLNVTFAQGEAVLRQWAGLPPKALSDLEKFNTAVEKLHRQWEEFSQDLVTKYLPDITRALDSLASSGWAEEIKRQIDFAIYDFVQLKNAAEAVAAAITRAFDAVTAAGTRAHEAFRGALEPRGPGGVPLDPSTPALSPDGNAAGGYIRGAGSGTSDSILARLSNGEFVMRASAVQRYGVGLMQQMNSGYAGGGTVRFAAGGFVGGGAGTPVHLHLGGHVFATTASSSVASALVSEAHRQAISSAGIKPSWFAARPGGR